MVIVRVSVSLGVIRCRGEIWFGLKSRMTGVGVSVGVRRNPRFSQSLLFCLTLAVLGAQASEIPLHDLLRFTGSKHGWGLSLYEGQVIRLKVR